MRKSLTLAVAGLIVFLIIFVLGWVLAYPSQGDPKNIEYMLWKAGLRNMDLDRAAETMIGDSHRDKLLVGKTKTQLREAFGYLLTPAEASTI